MNLRAWRIAGSRYRLERQPPAPSSMPRACPHMLGLWPEAPQRSCVGGRARTAELRVLPCASCAGAKRPAQATTWGVGARAQRASSAPVPVRPKTTARKSPLWTVGLHLIACWAKVRLGLRWACREIPPRRQSAPTYTHGPASGYNDKDWPLRLSCATTRRSQHGRQRTVSAR